MTVRSALATAFVEGGTLILVFGAFFAEEKDAAAATQQEASRPRRKRPPKPARFT